MRAKFCIYCRSQEIGHDWKKCYDHMLTLDKYFHKPQWCCYCGGYHKSLEHKKLMAEKQKKKFELPWWVSTVFYILVLIGIIRIFFYVLGFVSQLALLAVAGVVLYVLFTILRAKLKH